MRLGLRLEIGIGIVIDLHRSDLGLKLGLRLEIGIGIEIDLHLYVGTFESVNVGLGLGLRLKGRFGIEIGAAMGDWDWD